MLRVFSVLLAGARAQAVLLGQVLVVVPDMHHLPPDAPIREVRDDREPLEVSVCKLDQVRSYLCIW